MIVAVILLSVLCLALGAGLFFVFSRSNAHEKELEHSRENISLLRERAVKFEARAVYAEKEIERLRELNEKASAEADRHHAVLMEQSEARFRLLANELLSHHTRQMALQNEVSVGQILEPLKNDIDKFRRDVTSFYGKEAAERFSLQERIRELIEANNNIGREAKELSMALRGNSKIQGDWGEVVLSNILEKSGLRPGEEYEIQAQRDSSGRMLRNEDGHMLRPDVVVKYPGGKVMVIDSKTSLTAFVEYVNSETDSERERFGKLHLASVLKHVNELSVKNYQDYVGDRRLDFVMMFIPNEAAYNAAMSLDPTLWQKAYDKRVLVVSPTQLVASLKIVSQLWIQDRQTKNAIDIAERSGAMYDKFVGFVSDMEKIERSLTATRASYDSAMRKLRDGTGSLMVRAEKLRELGAKASKRLQGIDGLK